jgi:hypothetical protein
MMNFSDTYRRYGAYVTVLWVRIRIRIQHFKLIRIRFQIQGFYDQTLKKKQLKKMVFFSLIKIASKEIIQHFKK